MSALQVLVLDLLRRSKIMKCQLQAIEHIPGALKLETDLYGALGFLVVAVQPQMIMRQVYNGQLMTEAKSQQPHDQSVKNPLFI